MAFFVGGIIIKAASWLKKPVPFPQTLYPAPDSAAGRVMDIAQEIIIFRSLFRGDKCLWFWAWSLHVALAMVIGGHLVGIATLGEQFTALGVAAANSVKMSAFLGTASGFLLFAALVALFYRRVADPEVKRLSDPADYFDILFLLAIVVSGMHMRLTTHELDLAAIRSYLGSILAFSPGPLPKDWIFVSHYFLVLTFMIYFPFSKLAHLVGYFVNRALVNANAPVYPSAGADAKLELPRRVFVGAGKEGGVAK